MIDELARHPDPAAVHAELRRLGAHDTADGRWVVATAADVVTVLDSPAAAIGFAADPDRPVTALQARMARFTDGPAHAPRRAAVLRLLAGLDPTELRRTAGWSTAAWIAGRTELDVMELAHEVPVAVLAEALGVTDPAAAVAATADLALAMAPPLDSAPRAGVDRAITTLAGLLAHPADRDDEVADDDVADDDVADDDVAVAGISVLFQALDATAGLIGNALGRLRQGIPVDDLVAGTLRASCPVQLTTRVATAPLAVGGRTVPAGSRVVVVLAAATTDPTTGDPPNGGGRQYGFGAGPHACPGAEHAIAIASGVVDAMVAAGAVPDRPLGHEHPLDLERRVDHEHRVNLRVPRSVPVRLGATPSGSPRPAG